MSKQTLPTTPTNYPSDTVVVTEKAYYYIKATSRLRIPTERVLYSWNFARIVHTTEAAVAKYPVAGKLGFRNGTLLHNVADGKIYVVAEQKLRHITSPDVLGRLGATSKDLLKVSATEIALHAEGKEIE